VKEESQVDTLPRNLSTTGTSHALEVDLNENEWNEQTLLGRWTRYQTTACARGSAKEKPVSRSDTLEGLPGMREQVQGQSDFLRIGGIP